MLDKNWVKRRVVDNGGESSDSDVGDDAGDRVPVNLKVCPDFHAFVKDAADRRHQTISGLIHDSLDRLLGSVQTENKIVLGVRMKRGTYNRLKRVSKEVGIPMSRLIEKTVRRYVEKWEELR